MSEQPTKDQFPDEGTTSSPLPSTALFLEPTALHRAAAPTRELPKIPGYEILDVLGRGGMGVVYKAIQLSLKRVVAVKVILSGAAAGTEELARFRQEAEVLARLQHPNIVQVHEVGSWQADGGQPVPFLAMEFVPGGSLASHLAGNPQAPEEAARLVETLARGMHAAHAAGIVHRDLKPGNILLVSSEWSNEQTTHHTPLTTHQPKITDFGLAKCLDEDGQTQSGEVMGTPSYMAPEQAWGKAADVTPAADVYALGGILYECLTGRPPFRGVTRIETLDLVRTQEPIPPSRLAPRCPRDLETICLKCLQKDPDRRYSSALDLADDLRRFLNREPIRARPVSVIERASKWTRRRPAVAALVLAVVLVAGAGAGLFGWQYAQTRAEWLRAEEKAHDEGLAKDDAERARGRESTARAEAERQLYTAAIPQAYQQWQAGNLAGARLLLERCPVALRGWEWHYLHRQLQFRPVSIPGPAVFAVSGGGDRRLALTTPMGVETWDLAGNKRLLELPPENAPTGLALSSDGKRLAVGYALPAGPAARVLDAETGKVLATLLEPPPLPPDAPPVGLLPGGAGLTLVAFDYTASRVVVSGNLPLGTIRDAATGKDVPALPAKVYDAATGKELVTVQHPLSSRDPFLRAVISPDGTRLATACMEGEIVVWDAATGKKLIGFLPHRRDAARAQLGRLAFSPTGEYLAGSVMLGRGHYDVCVWEVATGRELWSFHGPTEGVSAIAFNPATPYHLAFGGLDGLVRVWDLIPGTGQPVELVTFRGQVGGVNDLAWTRDGQLLASAGMNGVQVWEASAGRESVALGRGTEAAFSPDGRVVASVTPFPPNPVELRDAVTGREVRHVGTSVFGPILFSPDGRRLAAICSTPQAPNRLTVWDVTTGADCVALPKQPLVPRHVLFSPGSEYLAIAGHDGPVRLFDADSGQERWSSPYPGPAGAIALSRDGKLLAIACPPTVRNNQPAPGAVKVVEVPAGREVCSVPGDFVSALHFCPDGEQLAVVLGNAEIGLWDARQGRKLLHSREDADLFLTVRDVVVSRDGRRLAMQCDGGLPHEPVQATLVWDVGSGTPPRRLRAHGQPGAGRVALSPDGKRLATVNGGTALQICNADTGEELLMLRAPVRLNRVLFSPDGARVLTLGDDLVVRVWDGNRTE